MNVLTLTGPAVEAVTLAECYSHLRLDPSLEGSPPALVHPDDAMLTLFIAAARREAEKLSRRSFVSQRLMLVTECFPGCYRHGYGLSHGYGPLPLDFSWGRWSGAFGNRSIPLPRGPVLSVNSVSYYDSANTLQTVDQSCYLVTDDQIPKLQFVPSFVYPATYPSGDAVRIEYMAGYPPSDDSPPDYAANVPAEAKAAILLGVQLLYDPLSPDQRDRIERSRAALLEGIKVYLTP